MPAAARIFDPTNHPGFILGGVINVLIGGRPGATQGHPHICLLPPKAGPHSPSALVGGSKTVLIGGKAAMRQGDKAGCQAVITKGAPTVIIGG